MEVYFTCTHEVSAVDAQVCWNEHDVVLFNGNVPFTEGMFSFWCGLYATSVPRTIQIHSVVIDEVNGLEHRILHDVKCDALQLMPATASWCTEQYANWRIENKPGKICQWS